MNIQYLIILLVLLFVLYNSEVLEEFRRGGRRGGIRGGRRRVGRRVGRRGRWWNRSLWRGRPYRRGTRWYWNNYYPYYGPQLNETNCNIYYPCRD